MAGQSSELDDPRSSSEDNRYDFNQLPNSASISFRPGGESCRPLWCGHSFKSGQACECLKHACAWRGVGSG